MKITTRLRVVSDGQQVDKTTEVELPDEWIDNLESVGDVSRMMFHSMEAPDDETTPAVFRDFTATAAESGWSSRTTGFASPLRISCTDCSLEHTAACDDCVVTFLLDHDRPERDHAGREESSVLASRRLRH